MPPCEEKVNYYTVCYIRDYFLIALIFTYSLKKCQYMLSRSQFKNSGKKRVTEMKYIHNSLCRASERGSIRKDFLGA